MLDADLWREMEDALTEFGPFIHADLSRGDTIEAMTRSALTSAPERFILIGFSMGGYVAREIARTAPERVEALILIATSARGDSPTLAARKAAATDKVTASNFNGMSRTAIVRSLHPDHANDDALIGRVRDMNKRLGPEAFVRQSSLVREDGRSRLSDIHCPTLVIAAAQDALRSLDEARELQEGVSGARLEVIEGTGHMIPLEAPDALSDVVKIWLSSIL